MLIWLIRRTSKVFLSKELDLLITEIRIIQISLERGAISTPSLCAQKMLVSAEDHRASKHCGIDILAICRAIFVYIFYRRREGASTIEQQVVRVITKRYEITFRRKLKEIFLAILISGEVNKKLFPAIYLTIGYYGTNTVGYEAICKAIGCKVDDESPAVAARIVSRLKYPEPRLTSLKKAKKILARELHITKLYHEHIEKGFHEYLCTRRFFPRKH